MLNFSRLSRFYDQANPGPRAGAGQMMVNRAGGQQAGNRSVVGVHAAVGQNDEVLALGNGLRRSVAQVVQSPVHRSRFRLEQRGQRGRRHSRQVQGLDLRQLLVGEQRRLEPQLPAVLRAFVEQVLLAADKRFQRSDQLLPDRVQRRVGHLGKQLLEIIKQGAVLVRQYRQRRVVAHGADRFVSGRCHGRGQHPQFFNGEAERALLLAQVVTPGRRQRLGGRQAFQFYLICLEPIAIGLAAGQCVLQLFVADYPALVETDQEHAARLQPTFLLDAFRRQVQHAGLGRHDQLIVVGHRVPERSESVAVQNCADVLAVSGQHHGRPIPRFHHARVELVEVLFLLGHGFMLVPRLRNHHQHGVGQIPARHHQQFQRVVKTGGVTGLRIADRSQFVDVVAVQRGTELRFPGMHPVDVAAQRVDLAIVRQIAIGVRQLPVPQRVRAEPGVHQRESRYHRFVVQVGIKIGQLV